MISPTVLCISKTVLSLWCKMHFLVLPSGIVRVWGDDSVSWDVVVGAGKYLSFNAIVEGWRWAVLSSPRECCSFVSACSSFS